MSRIFYITADDTIAKFEIVTDESNDDSGVRSPRIVCQGVAGAKEEIAHILERIATLHPIQKGIV